MPVRLYTIKKDDSPCLKALKQRFNQKQRLRPEFAEAVRRKQVRYL